MSENAQPFGDRSWGDLREALTWNMRRRYPRREVDDAVVGDAVSAAMVDLYDYWQHLPSSLDSEDTQRNWKFALTRGQWTCLSYIEAERANESVKVSITETHPNDEEVEAVLLHSDLSAEDEYFQAEFERAVYRMASAMLTDMEHGDSLRGILNGESVRAEARRRGVHRNTVAAQRKVAVKELLERLA